MKPTLFILFNLMIATASQAHLIRSKERMMHPTDLTWTHHNTVTSLLQDFKYDGFSEKLEQSKIFLKTASRVEAERIEIEAKHQVLVYENLEQKLRAIKKEIQDSGSAKEQNDLRQVLLEIKSRIILSQSLQNRATLRTHDFLMEDVDSEHEIHMDIKAPKLFDDSIFQEYHPPVSSPPFFIEPH